MKKILKLTLLFCTMFCFGETCFCQNRMMDPKANTINTGKKNFVLIIRLPRNYEHLPVIQEAWVKLLAQWKADSVYVNSFIFPAEGMVLSDGKRIPRKEYVYANNLWVASTTILRAKDMEEMVQLAKACPILDYGGSVEIREIR